jgi:guanylate kinase
VDATPRFARRGIVFIVSGPSGAGKSTLVAAVLERHADLTLSISYTTRAPRAGEQHGREYTFVDRGEFERRRAAGEFAEWAEVHDAFYGTARAPLDEAVELGVDMLLDVDVQGARQLKKAYGEAAVAVMVLPPSWDELERRLTARRTETPDRIARRLARARDEAAAVRDYDYWIVNGERDAAAATLNAIIDAERARVGRIVT